MRERKAGSFESASLYLDVPSSRRLLRSLKAMSFLTSTSTFRVVAPSRLHLRGLHCLRLTASTLRITRTLPQKRVMTTRDVSHQADISQSFANRPKDSDGSFNRRPSTFRDTIAKGSKYEPEKGTSGRLSFRPSPWEILTTHREVPPLRLLRLSMGSSYAHHAYPQRPGGLHRCYHREPSHGRARLAFRCR